MPRETFATRLTWLRTRLRLGLGEADRLACVRRNTHQRLEGGGTERPTPRIVAALALLYGVTSEWLYGGGERPRDEQIAAAVAGARERQLPSEASRALEQQAKALLGRLSEAAGLPPSGTERHRFLRLRAKLDRVERTLFPETGRSAA